MKWSTLLNFKINESLSQNDENTAIKSNIFNRKLIYF